MNYRILFMYCIYSMLYHTIYHYILLAGYHSFQYFMQIVPTEIRTYSTNKDTYQFAVTEKVSCLPACDLYHNINCLFWFIILNVHTLSKLLTFFFFFLKNLNIKETYPVIINGTSHISKVQEKHIYINTWNCYLFFFLRNKEFQYYLILILETKILALWA